MTSKRHVTQAIAPGGVDAFEAIAKRIADLGAPVEAVAKIADKLPAGDAFLLFVKTFALLQDAYELYLDADLAKADAAKSAADRVITDLSRS